VTLETHELLTYFWMGWMKSESTGIHIIYLIFRIVLGYYTLRRSEMVGSVSATTPDISYNGAEYRVNLVNCA